MSETGAGVCGPTTRRSRDQTMDLEENLEWLAENTANFSHMANCLKMKGFLSSKEINQMKTLTSPKDRFHSLYRNISKKEGWFGPVMECLENNGNIHVVEYLEDIRVKELLKGSVEDKKHQFDVIALKKKVIQLNEELEKYRRLREDERTTELRNHLQIAMSNSKNLENKLMDTKSQLKVKVKELEYLLNQREQQISEQQKVVSKLQTTVNPHLIIQEIGSADNILDYEQISNAKYQEWKKIASETKKLDFKHINMNLERLIADLQHFTKLKTISLKKAHLTGFGGGNLQDRKKFFALLPELEECIMHLRAWKPNWNSNYDDFANEVMFFNTNTNTNGTISIPNDLLEVADCSTMKLKVNRTKGEIIISGLQFIDMILRLPLSENFHLRHLAIEACNVNHSFPTMHLETLVLNDVNLTTEQIKVIIKRCVNLNVLKINFPEPINENHRHIFTISDFPFYKLKEFSLSNCTLKLGDFNLQNRASAYQLDSLYFHKCLIDPEITKYFQLIFECKKFAFTFLYSLEFLTYEFLDKLLKIPTLEWIFMSDFDRIPKTTKVNEIHTKMENFFTKIGITKQQQNFLIVKDENNNAGWQKGKISEKKLIMTLAQMNGHSKFIAI